MRRTKSDKQRTRARRAAERAHARRPSTSSTSTLTPEQHAQRIATLRAEKRELSLQLERVNELLDSALIAARNDNVKHAAVAYAVQLAEGRPSTAKDLEQLEAELRKATHHARQRRDPKRIERKLDGRCARRETGRMRNLNPYRRRVEVTEEWYGEPPPEELGTSAAPTLVGDEGLEGVDGDDDLDDNDNLDDEDLEDDDEDDR